MPESASIKAPTPGHKNAFLSGGAIVQLKRGVAHAACRFYLFKCISAGQGDRDTITRTGSFPLQQRSIARMQKKVTISFACNLNLSYMLKSLLRIFMSYLGCTAEWSRLA